MSLYCWKACHRSALCHHCYPCYSALHSRRPIACLHHSVPHFNWSILLKYDSERCVSVYHVNQHNVCLCVKGCRCVCACVWYHALSFWMMSCFLCLFSPGLLNLLCCSSLLFPSLIHFSLFFMFLSVFSLYLCLFLSVWYLSKTAEHSGIPVKSFFWDCFTVTV